MKRLLIRAASSLLIIMLGGFLVDSVALYMGGHERKMWDWVFWVFVIGQTTGIIWVWADDFLRR